MEKSNGDIALQILVDRIDNTKRKIQEGETSTVCNAHKDVSEGLCTLLEVEKYHLEKGRKSVLEVKKWITIIAIITYGVLLGAGWFLQNQISDIEVNIRPALEQFSVTP